MQFVISDPHYKQGVVQRTQLVPETPNPVLQKVQTVTSAAHFMQGAGQRTQAPAETP